MESLQVVEISSLVQDKWPKERRTQNGSTFRYSGVFCRNAIICRSLRLVTLHRVWGPFLAPFRSLSAPFGRPCAKSDPVLTHFRLRFTGRNSRVPVRNHIPERAFFYRGSEAGESDGPEHLAPQANSGIG